MDKQNLIAWMMFDKQEKEFYGLVYTHQGKYPVESELFTRMPHLDQVQEASSTELERLRDVNKNHLVTIHKQCEELGALRAFVTNINNIVDVVSQV